jgi:hypothetical protein
MHHFIAGEKENTIDNNLIFMFVPGFAGAIHSAQ